MDILADDFDGFISYLFEQSSNLVTRDLSVCYYDCTNFYFEIEKEDEDYIDEVTGEIIRGLREYGFSKEHRPNPLVQMGLFMDSDVKPPPAASCRVFKVLRRSEFCSFCPHGIFIVDKSRQNEAKRCKSRPPTVVEK